MKEPMPGPWTLSNTNGYLTITAADGQYVIADWDINEDSSVGICCDVDQEIANFTLIAAAPKLLEACQALTKAFRIPRHALSEEMARIYNQARAAITEAKGGKN